MSEHARRLRQERVESPPVAAVPKATPWLNAFLVAGTRGAAPLDDETPLDPRRRALAWASFAILALILLPFPHALSRGFGLHCPYL